MKTKNGMYLNTLQKPPENNMNSYGSIAILAGLLSSCIGPSRLIVIVSDAETMQPVSNALVLGRHFFATRPAAVAISRTDESGRALFTRHQLGCAVDFAHIEVLHESHVPVDKLHNTFTPVTNLGNSISVSLLSLPSHFVVNDADFERIDAYYKRRVTGEYRSQIDKKAKGPWEAKYANEAAVAELSEWLRLSRLMVARGLANRTTKGPPTTEELQRSSSR